MNIPIAINDDPISAIARILPIITPQSGEPTKESIMPPIRNDWAKVLAPEYNKPYYRKLFDFVGKEYSTHTIYPPGDDIFNAFHLTPLKDVKCVIIGQDPYHGPGQAHGLSFSVKPGVEIPPSLVNIYKEIKDDVGSPITDIWSNGQSRAFFCSTQF